MKNILIPTDFSENAWNATQYAIELFKDEECNFHILNTYTPAISSSRFMAASVEGELLENTAKNKSLLGLKNIVDRIARELKNSKHRVETTSSYSFLVDEIKDILDSKHIDCIVMGTQGATGLKEVFMGTHTVKVIKSIRNCPVLVVPKNVSFSKATEIAFATDYKRSYDAEMLLPLRQLATKTETTIRIAHITEKEVLNRFQEANMHVLSEYLQAINHTLHWLPSYASKSEVIGEFIEDMKIDILAMVYVEHSPLIQLMREPVIKHMAFHTQIPLLVLPEYGYNELSNSETATNVVLGNQSQI